MTSQQLETTSIKNERVVPVEPEVKSSKTCKLSLPGVSAKAGSAKTADPTCYNACTVDGTGLFENVEMKMSNAKHTRPEIVGNYRIIWARSLLTHVVSYRVYYREAIDPMSEHPSKPQARAAVKRYAAADARRERDRKRGEARPLTEHLESLGCLGPLPA